MMVKPFQIIILFLLAQTLCAQDYLPRTNWINDLGNREGVWRLTNGYSTFEVIYENGIRNYAFKEITREGNSPVFGQYRDGKLYSACYHFDDDANLVCMLHGIKSNTTVICQHGNSFLYPEFCCFYVEYFKDKSVKKEGLLLWSIGAFPLDGSALPYGLWRTYDKSGKVLHVENFLFTPFYKKPEKPMTVPCDYKWALTDETLLLPYQE